MLLLLLLWCYGCTWRERRHGDKDVDRGRVDIVVGDKGLLPVRVLRDCHVVVCVSQLPLPLSWSLLDRVPVVVLVAAVVFRLHLKGRASR